MWKRLGTFDRLAFWSLAAVPAALVLVMVATRLTSGDVAGAADTLTALTVLAVVMAVAIVLRGRAPIPVFVLAGLVTLGTLAAGSEFALRHPEDFPGFVAGLVPVVALGTAAVAGFIARRRRRAGRSDDPLSTRTRRITRALPTATVALILASAVVALFDEPELASGDDPAQVITESDRFVPWEFVVRSGERAEFVLRNRDDYAHTFTIDELKIDRYIGPRAARRIAFDVDHAPGEIRLYCDIRGHEDMVGTVTIE